MNKLELTFALEQIARGFPRAAADLADHFFPEPQTVEVALPAVFSTFPSTIAEGVSVMPAGPVQVFEAPFPSAESVEAMKAGDLLPGEAPAAEVVEAMKMAQQAWAANVPAAVADAPKAD